jgi:hypothetical protein
MAHWRSLGKWLSRGATISWAHKHTYPRSLNLKAVLSLSQTARSKPAAGPKILSPPFRKDEPRGHGLDRRLIAPLQPTAAVPSMIAPAVGVVAPPIEPSLGSPPKYAGDRSDDA